MKRGRRSNQNKGNSKSIKPSYKTSKECGSKGEEQEYKKSGTNDPSWYAVTPELLRDAASIPFSNAAGTSYKLNYGSTEYSDAVSDQYVPGIIVFQSLPSIGDSGQINSPLNIASNALYAQVRRANSGSANYDAPNLFMYCMAVAQCYSYINYLMRVYGTAQLYIQYNRYLPQVLLQAQEVHFDSINEHLADFRYGINLLIRKVASFACPASLTYFRRLAFLYSGIYAEGESIKDQLYIYNPIGFMQLTEQDTTPGWALKFKAFADGKGLKTYSQLLKYGNELLQPLLSSEDFNIISGDILKAFGSDILTLQALPELYTILPSTDLEVLEQMQNCDYFHRTQWQTGAFFEIKENPNTNLISAQAVLTATLDDPVMAICQDKWGSGNHVLTTILTNPTPENVIERTRLMWTGDTFDSDVNKGINLITGSDFVTNVFIYTIEAGQPRQIQVDPVYVMNNGSTIENYQWLLRVHCELENFKFHPRVEYWVQNTAGGKYTYLGAAVDIDNYAILSTETVANMNEAALMSLLNVPSLSSFK